MIKVLGVLGIICLGLHSCGDADVVYQETKEIPATGWHKDTAYSFNFEIADTTTLHDFYFDLRTTSAYEWSNLFVFVEIKAPNDKFNIDTVEFVLANKKGEWNGKKSGSIVENDLLFITKKRFPEVGPYSLTFSQAMREDVLNEVVDVGLKIKEVKLD